MKLSTAIGKLQSACMDVVWRQWGELGALTGKRTRSHSAAVIDIEALLLASLWLRDRERRLDDFPGWWSGAGAHLTSVQRARNLTARFPTGTADRLAGFSELAARSGDPRWRTLTRHAN